MPPRKRNLINNLQGLDNNMSTDTNDNTNSNDNKENNNSNSNYNPNTEINYNNNHKAKKNYNNNEIDENNRYRVIEGMHRIEGIKELYNEGAIKHSFVYAIVLGDGITPKEEIIIAAASNEIHERIVATTAYDRFIFYDRLE